MYLLNAKLNNHVHLFHINVGNRSGQIRCIYMASFPFLQFFLVLLSIVRRRNMRSDNSHPATNWLEAKMFANVLGVAHMNANLLCIWSLFIDFIHSFMNTYMPLLVFLDLHTKINNKKWSQMVWMDVHQNKNNILKIWFLDETIETGTGKWNFTMY